MKLISELTVKDLEEHGVWIYHCADNFPDNKAHVTPTSLKECPPDGSDEIYIVQTRFTLNDGSVYFGYCSPADPSGLDYIQPVLITDAGQIQFWHDVEPHFNILVDAESKLGKKFEGIFPIQYESLIFCEGQKIKDLIKEIVVIK